MADIFISYKREDRDFAERLAHALEQLGFDVWWDFDLLAGDRYRKVIREVIDKCSAAVVLWSGRSVESDFVMDEAGHAKNRGKLCPARIDEVDLPFGFGQTHTDDLIGWDGELTHPGFQGLVRSLETRVGRKARLGALRRSPESQAQSAELEAFRVAQLAGNPAALRTFLSQHPRGEFAGFVRSQIESMDTPPPRAEVAAPAAGLPPAEEHPAERSAPSPREQSVAGQPPPQPKPVTRRSLPWPKIAGIGIVIAGLAGLYMYQSAQEDARRARVEIEAQRKQAEDERRAREAAEARAKEVEAKAQSDRAAREEAERERIALQKAEGERIARERAEREKAEREAERQRASEQQRLAREKAERENTEREREARERAAREAEAKARAAAQPASYDLDQLDPQVRAAVARARDAERRANAAAARARNAAERARASGARSPKSGVGIYVSDPDGKFAGDEYAGTYENGQRSGLGVYSYGQNENNTANALRYEGELASGKWNGYGVFLWRNGSRHAGVRQDNLRNGPGVFTFASGVRYEGEWAADRPSGHGVEWDAQGRVRRAGIWSASKLTTPLGSQGR